MDERGIREARRREVETLQLAGVPVRETVAAIRRAHPDWPVSVGTIHNDRHVNARRWVEETRQDHDVLVAREKKRLDRLWDAFMTPALSGDVGAGRLLVRISRETRSLMGLDRPRRVEVSGPDGGAVPVSVEERAASIADDIEAYVAAQAEGDAAEAAAAAEATS